MNSIIINGKNSNTVKGLLIQSLPPISKPLMRTNVETIDGRDGDIVTKLGYSAYNKTVSVGLHGDFDVDDAIKFFDSEGTVTFSNEPDKLYNFQILEEIDFERLLRFRTATVTFHVQPFKYSAVDDYFVHEDAETRYFEIINRGNTVARPVITIHGTGTVGLYVNSALILTINMGDAGYITIDAPRMNAYRGDVLMNRSVTGKYEDLTLRVGRNVISWTGSVTKVEITRFARWI